MPDRASVEPRIACFVDANNIHISLKKKGWQMNYDKLRDWLDARGYVVGAPHVYYSEKPPEQSPDKGELKAEPRDKKFTAYIRNLGKMGFRIFVKPASEVHDTLTGKVVGYKGNCDMEIAVDIMDFIRNADLDELFLFSGDRDFTYLVDRLKPLGIRVTVAAVPGSVALMLIESADDYIKLDEKHDLVQKMKPYNGNGVPQQG